MTAKEFLRQYDECNRRAERYRQEYERELELIDSVKSTLDTDGLPHGSGVSRVTEDRALRLADKAAAWKMAQLDAIEARQRVFDMIRDVPGKPGEVLYERYVNLSKWEDICHSLNVSWNSMHYNHRQGLRLIQDMMGILV